VYKVQVLLAMALPVWLVTKLRCLMEALSCWMMLTRTKRSRHFYYSGQGSGTTRVNLYRSIMRVLMLSYYTMATRKCLTQKKNIAETNVALHIILHFQLYTFVIVLIPKDSSLKLFDARTFVKNLKLGQHSPIAGLALIFRSKTQKIRLGYRLLSMDTCGRLCFNLFHQIKNFVDSLHFELAFM
jgi:hypothetical protein